MARGKAPTERSEVRDLYRGCLYLERRVRYRVALRVSAEATSQVDVIGQPHDPLRELCRVIWSEQDPRSEVGDLLGNASNGRGYDW